MPRLIQLFALATALGSLLITDCPRGRAQDRAVIQTGKASVALVEVGKDKVASAFCIDPLGVFVTNHHVVEDLGLRGSVKLVMQSSEADEWSLSAEVVLMNKADDLAVLKAYSVPRDKKLTALELAREPNLYETMDLIAFGFPFGKQLTVKKGENPSISVNVGKLTAIRKESGVVEYIQLDATLNPGNSGGPVVDASGKVVGIVSFGLLASGVNFAIPVEKLWPMLHTPFYSVDAGGLLLDPYIPSDVRVGLISMQKDIPDLSAEIWCIGSTSGKIEVPLKSIAKNQFEGPVSVSQDDPKKIPLRGRIVLSEGQIRGVVANDRLVLNGKELWLSSIASMRRSEDGKTNSILLQDGNALTVDAATLPQLKVDCGEVPASIPLSKAVFAEFERGKQQDDFVFNLVIKSQGKVIIQEVINETMSQAAELYAKADAQADSQSDRAINSLNMDLTAGTTRQRPKYTGKQKTIPLPSEMTDVARAADGRFLLVTMSGTASLAIIDLDQSEIVKILPLSSPEALVAGTMEHFFVVDPIKKNLQRYSLATLELEKVAPSACDGKILAIVAGEASNGPLLMICESEKGGLSGANWMLVDPLKLKSIPFEVEKRGSDRIRGVHSGSGQSIRASADGKVFGAWGSLGSPSGVIVARLSDRYLTARYEHSSFGHVVPTADGMHILTGSGGVLSPSLSGVESTSSFQTSSSQPTLFPTSHPNIYLSVRSRKSNDRPVAQDTLVHVRQFGAEAPLAGFPLVGLEVMSRNGALNGPILDKRLYLDVEAGILVSIPFSNDTILVQPFDMQAELKKSAADYLVATPPKNKKFTPGAIYQTQITAETNRPNIGYRLLSGPSGMKVSATGELLWKVPGLFTQANVDIIVSITSDGVHQNYVSFPLSNSRNY